MFHLKIYQTTLNRHLYLLGFVDYTHGLGNEVPSVSVYYYRHSKSSQLVPVNVRVLALSYYFYYTLDQHTYICISISISSYFPNIIYRSIFGALCRPIESLFI